METQIEAVATPVVESVVSTAAAEQETVVSPETETETDLKTYLSLNALTADKLYRHWLNAGFQLGEKIQNANFVAGDWLNEGLAAFKLDEKAAHLKPGFLIRQAAIAARLSPTTIKMYAVVAAKIPSQRRMIDRLSFTHHRAVADAPPSDQTRYLELAFKNKWPVSKLTARLIADNVMEKKPKPGYSVTQDRDNFLKRLQNLFPKQGGMQNIQLAAEQAPQEYKQLAYEVQKVFLELQMINAKLNDPAKLEKLREDEKTRNQQRLKDYEARIATFKAAKLAKEAEDPITVP